MVKINQKYIDKQIIKLNQIVDQYESEFGPVGFKKLPETGTVSLISEKDTHKLNTKPGRVTAIYYHKGEDKVYIIKENLEGFLTVFPQKDSGIIFKGVGNNTTEFSILSLLCPHGIVSRSLKTHNLSMKTSQVYSELFYSCLDEKEEYNVLFDEDTIFKSRGFTIWAEKDGKIIVDSKNELHEIIEYSLTARIMGLHLFNTGEFNNYLSAQAPYCFIGGEHSDHEHLAKTMKFIDNKHSIKKFTKDFINGTIPETIIDIATAKLDENNVINEKFYTAFLVHIYSAPDKFPQLYKPIYG